MQRDGLRPGAADGSYRQPVPLVGIKAAIPSSVVVSGTSPGAASVTLSVPDDFVAMSGVQKPAVDLVASELVFVGYGIVAPEYQWDDYKDVDVRGKTVVVMNNDPEDDPQLFAGKTRLWYGRWDYKYLEAARHGASGAIVIHTTPSAGYPWQVVTTSNAHEKFELPARDEAPAPGEDVGDRGRDAQASPRARRRGPRQPPAAWKAADARVSSETARTRSCRSRSPSTLYVAH